MSNIAAAEYSPRIVNGELHWYEGDTFSVQLKLDLQDQDGESITIDSDAVVQVVFKNQRRETVLTLSFTDIQNNIITIVIDSARTETMPAGRYTYDIYYTKNDRVTIVNNSKVVVEE